MECWKRGRLLVGVDEAGRGALAGPVAAAAVVFADGAIPAGMQDSKRVDADTRRELASGIKATALAWSVALVHQDRIDTINILQATFDAMHQAIDDVIQLLHPNSNVDLRIDGNRFRPHRLPWSTIIGGDGISPTIAAASILAKTTRDEWMDDIDEVYPVYGFGRHKGYATVMHRDAIREHGPCEIHRRTFLVKLLSQRSSSGSNG
jgi:ribonuclease HII